ncbi:unnamed protein product [Caenorhabditis sp. 36 PRJEB53466]|nr:unnamed protein product [Caenorhabditis sp. 36 PRJEB53466]
MRILLFLQLFLLLLLARPLVSQTVITSIRTIRDSVAHYGSTFDDFISKMRVLARLSNGISLQIGLFDGSVPLDEVLFEVLRMGNVSSVDLVELRNQMEPPMNALKRLRNMIMGDKRLEHLDGAIWRLNEAKNPMRWFVLMIRNDLRGLDMLANEFRNDSVLSELKWTVYRLSTETIKTDWSSDTNSNETNDESNILKSLSKYLIDLESQSIQFEPRVANVIAMKNVANHPAFLFFNETKYWGMPKNEMRDFEERIPIEIFEESEKVIMELINSSLPAFHRIEQILETCAKRIPIQLKHTIGLPNGQEDLEKFYEDAGDKWLGSIFELTETAITKLRKALFYMEIDFKKPLKSLNNYWNNMSRPFLDSASLMPPRMDQQVLDAQFLKEKFKKLAMCINSNTQLSIVIDEKALSPIKALKEELNTLSTFDYLQEARDHVTTLQKVMGFTNETQFNISNTPEFVKRLKSSPEVDTAHNFFRSMWSDLDKLKNLVNEVPIRIKTITDNFPIIEDFYKKQAPVKSCLEVQLSEDNSVTRELVGMVRRLSAFGEQIGTYEEVLKHIFGMSDRMEDARHILETARAAMDSETRALKEAMPDAQRVSFDLGLAVQGLTAIRTLMDRLGEFGPLLGDLSFVRDANVKDQLEGLKTALTRIYSDTVQFLGTLAPMDEAGMYSNAFEAAANISIIDLNVKKVKDAVEDRLGSQPELRPIFDALKKLRKMDLNFAKYSFTNAISSLESLDVFFAKFSNSTSDGKEETTKRTPFLKPFYMIESSEQPFLTTFDIFGLLVLLLFLLLALFLFADYKMKLWLWTMDNIDTTLVISLYILALSFFGAVFSSLKI